MSHPGNISIDDYDYALPEERIALHPLSQRDACKLLVRDSSGNICDKIFSELPDLLPADALLVYNNTRVINARLRFRKSSQADSTSLGALIEIFCLEPVQPIDYALNFATTSSCSWLCFVGNAKKWKQGSLHQSIDIDGETVILKATQGDACGNARIITFEWDNPAFSFARIIETAGEIPIPPYLNRPTDVADSKDYQTVYSHIDGSVAAPTAGLHFTPQVLAAISSHGIERHELTLHVGAGTFQPVKTDCIAEHMMHSEFISVSRSLIERLMSEDKQVIAVGTTSVRTLESLYHAGTLIATGRWNGEVPQWYPYEADYPLMSVKQSLQAILDYLDHENLDSFVADTRIIIAPGYQYRVVKGMITNFHQPRSTLLLLVSAFIGTDWQRVYDHALREDYRFLSYGDACLFM